MGFTVGRGSTSLNNYLFFLNYKNKHSSPPVLEIIVPDLYVFGRPGSRPLVGGTDPDPSIIKQI